MQHLSVRRIFWNHLPEDEQQFLDGVVLQRHHEANDSHEQTLHLLSVQDHGYDSLESHDFRLDVSILCRKKYGYYIEEILVALS